MSISTWVNYGIGARIDSSKATVERIQNLLHLAPNYEEWVTDIFEDDGITNPTVRDYEELDDTCCCGLATLLCEVIHEAEGIEMTACDDDSSNVYILYSPKYPWQIQEDCAKERGLTRENIVELLGKYLKLLTGEDVDIDDQEVTNYG